MTGGCLLPMAEVSRRTGVGIETLRYWRKIGDGPPSFKLGKRVVYDETDLHEWIAARRAATSSGVIAGGQAELPRGVA